MVKRKKSAKSGSSLYDLAVMGLLNVELLDGSIVAGPILDMYLHDLEWLFENAGIEGRNILQDLLAFYSDKKTRCDESTLAGIPRYGRNYIGHAGVIGEWPFRETNLRNVIRNAVFIDDDGQVAVRYPGKRTVENMQAQLVSNAAMLGQVREEAIGDDTPSSAVGEIAVKKKGASRKPGSTELAP